MYKIKLCKFILPVVFLCSANLAFAQWSWGVLPHLRFGNSVQIIDANTVVFAGGNQQNDSLRDINISDDKGYTWAYSLDEAAPWMRGVRFVNLLTGVAVGDSGAIVRTADGGQTWSTIPAPGNCSHRVLTAINFPTWNDGYIAGGYSGADSFQTILKTVDGGNTWSVLTDTPGYCLQAIYFTDSINGYAAGLNGTILKTTNAGLSWTAVSLPANLAKRNFNAIYFSNPDTGFAVGGFPAPDSFQTIIKTVDGGSNWNIITDITGPMLNAVSFATVTEAYAAGISGIILKSSDGGNSWATIHLPVADSASNAINSVDFLNADFGIFVGDYGTLLRYIDSTPTSPGVITEIASGVNNTVAQLNGMVNANGPVTTAGFDYGTTLALAEEVSATPDSLSGTMPGAISAQLSGLIPNTFYYYRAKAINASGVNYGDIMKLYTTDCEVPNCDFEVWDTTYGAQPVGWQTIGIVTKVPSYNGTNAVQLQSDRTLGVGGIVIGNINQGSHGDTAHVISGGIPFAARPDSIRLHAKYYIAAGDTAWLALFFGLNGSLLNAVLIPITGNTTGNFTSLAFPITFTDNRTPDSLAVGIISSNAFGNNINVNSILTVDDITFAGTNLLLPNWNFEQWDSIPNINLQSWSASPGSNGSLDPNLVQPTTDKESGHYAALMQSSNGRGTSIVVGPAITNDSAAPPTFPIAGRHTSLNMYIKFLPQSGADTLFINSAFFLGDSIVAGLNYIIDTPVLNYTPMSFNYTYYSSLLLTPDSANLQLLVRGTDSLPCLAYIDNISFDDFRVVGPVAITPLAPVSNVYFNVFPNPASSALNVFTFMKGECRLEIYDLQGGLLFTDYFTGGRYVFNVEGLPDAVYLLRVSNGENQETKKVTVIR